MEPVGLLCDDGSTASLPGGSTPPPLQHSEATALPLAMAKRVYVHKQTVLHHALQSMSLKMYGAKSCLLDDGQLLGSVSIDVPPHGEYPLLHERTFYGDYKLTENDALESACLAALLYLQEAGIIVVDDVNLAKLANCQAQLADHKHRLLAASSWADMFVERAECLQAKLDIAKETNEQLLSAVKASGVKEDVGAEGPSNVKAEELDQEALDDKNTVFSESVCHTQADASSSLNKKRRTLPATAVRRSLFQISSTNGMESQSITGEKGGA